MDSVDEEWVMRSFDGNDTLPATMLLSHRNRNIWEFVSRIPYGEFLHRKFWGRWRQRDWSNLIKCEIHLMHFENVVCHCILIMYRNQFQSINTFRSKSILSINQFRSFEMASKWLLQWMWCMARVVWCLCNRCFLGMVNFWI